MLKDENVSINLKYCFPFEFVALVLTHDCVVHEEKKLTKARNLMPKELLVPLTPVSRVFMFLDLDSNEQTRKS